MSVSQVSSRGTDFSSLPNVLFPSSGSFRYASGPSEQNEPPSATGEAAAPSLVIWGTDVNVDQCKRQFIEFIKESRFTIEEADMDEARLDWQQSDEPRPLYLAKLEEILQVPNEPYFTLNCAHIKEFNQNLYRQLVFYPTEMIQIFDCAINELFQELFPEQNESIIISVRPFNIDQTLAMRSLNPNDIGKLITVSGMVTRCSPIIPEMVRAFFKCENCLFTREASVENGKIDEPHVCTTCNSKFSFIVDHNRCRFVDKQLVKVQESPEDMPAGQTPTTASVVACADLVDKVAPGDRIYITGIYRANPMRVMARQRRLRAAFRPTIDVLHYRKIKSGRLHDESSMLRLNPDRVDKLKALGKDGNIYSRLAKSLCPSIFGHLGVKRGVLLQLFGGTQKESQERNNEPKLRHFRSEINILLCGDPGTSKSQILQYVYKLVPRGQYTSGKGSSAVGLTAYVTRDVDTKQLVLQIGALVMCDGGICCIDEFDKMSDSTRSVLHEVMEQQTLSIAKAGIVCQLNARTSVLAAANPVTSSWNPEGTIIENIKMSETLLSRFDLIFLLLDPDMEEYDKQLANHLINIYHQKQQQDPDLIPHDLLKDYIAYAKANVQPKLTPNAISLLIQNYVSLRKDRGAKGTISVYPRNLESLIRLSEAHARVRLSNEVELEDIEEAVRLTKEAAKFASTDKSTGRINPMSMEEELQDKNDMIQ